MRGYKEGMTSNGGGGQTDDAGKMSENTRNIQNDGKSTKNPSIDKRITKKKKSRLTINFKIVYKIDNMN